MRLVSFASPAGRRPAAVVGTPGDERLLDLADAIGVDDVESLLADDQALAAARSSVAAADVSRLPRLAEATLLAPVVPGKIVCLGYNYRGHVPDGVDPRASDPEFPDVFVKTPNTLGGPSDAVAVPHAAEDVDYEGEIAIVIGRRAKEVPVESALDHVAGYTILNDVSDRAWQRRQSQWALGKCFDGFAPLGPWVVTADEIADPHDLLVEVERDGVVTVSQSTATTIFSVPFIVSYLSQTMTLQPGDVISTGTPQKLPHALAAHRPLAPGDSVTVRVGGIGELTTRFVAPTQGVPA